MLDERQGHHRLERPAGGAREHEVVEATTRVADAVEQETVVERSNAASDVEPAWHPDGRLCFVSNRTGQTQIGPESYAGSAPNEGGGRSINSNSRFEEINTYNIWDYGEFKFVFEDPFRTGEYRLYSPRADQIGAGALPCNCHFAIAAVI